MKIRKSVEIAAPGKKIWPFLTGPEKILQWCFSGEKLVRTSNQYSGPGTSFYFEEKALGRLMRLNLVVTEWVENECVAFTMTSGNFVKGYKQKYTIEAMPSGSKCTCFEDVKLPYGILGKAAGLFRKHFSENLLETMLGRLKELAEA